MRILHLLHRSVPGTHGYAIRSRQIVRSQLEKGLEPIVITSPSQAPLGELDSERSEVIDGIRYIRTCSNVLRPSKDVKDGSPVKASLRVLQNAAMLTTAMRVTEKYRPAIIHAHSPFTCGIIGNIVGRRKGLPSVYEVRGIWEASQVARGMLNEMSLRYKVVRFLENRALRGADACCTIGEALADEVVSRGINRDKIVIVPNGVDVKAFVLGPPKETLQKALGLDGMIIMGYIGSFFYYEGLDLLVDAMAKLAGELPTLRLLLVGGGEHELFLRRRTCELGIEDRVAFVGRVPHEQVTDYYRLCDFLVLPRREGPETKLVTPLKPMEIMAMEKLVLASDIGGHRETIAHRRNGYLFRSGDLNDLVAKCRDLAVDPGLCMEIGRKAREWVVQNRDWAILVERYLDLYSRLTGKG